MFKSLPLFCLGALSFGGITAARPPLYADPVRLNIGYVCKWQVACVEKQQTAMRKALSYVKRYNPPKWKIQQCNRNAYRGRSRVDWLGYYNCIRNLDLSRRPARR